MSNLPKRSLRSCVRVAAAFSVTALVAGVLLFSSVAGAATSAAVGAPGTWSLAGSGIRTLSGQIGTARTADGVLHVVWSRGGAGTPFALLETTVTPAGKVSSPKAIISGWSRIDDVAATFSKGRPLAVVFTGTKTDTTGDPTNGLNLATRSGSGWTVKNGAIYAKNFASSSVPSISYTELGTLLQAWSANGDVVVHVGTDPAVPTISYGKGSNVSLWPGVYGTSVGGNSGAETSLLAWCSSEEGAGIYWRSFYTEGPSANYPARRMPGSATTRCPAANRTPLASSTDTAATVGAERTVRVWGSRGNSFVSSDVASGHGIKQQVALASDQPRRLWVGWRDADSNRLLLRRSNDDRTRWGAVVSTAIPGSQDSVYTIDLAAQDDRVDVIVRTTKGSAVSLYQTQMFPGLTVAATSKGGRVTATVTDAGEPVPGSSVRIGGRLLHTDKEGKASTDLPAGTYKVIAAKPKYVGATTSATVKKD